MQTDRLLWRLAERTENLKASFRRGRQLRMMALARPILLCGPLVQGDYLPMSVSKDFVERQWGPRLTQRLLLKAETVFRTLQPVIVHFHSQGSATKRTKEAVLAMW